MFDTSSCSPEVSVIAIGVECGDEVRVNYYFDVYRPMAATKNMARMMGAWLKEVE